MRERERKSEKYSFPFLYKYFHSKIFSLSILVVLHDLVSSVQLAGTVHGRGDKALYIPSIYTQMQNQWADNFLATNGYLGNTLISLMITINRCVCVCVFIAIFNWCLLKL